MVLSRNELYNKALWTEFQQRRVEKTYLAIVRGRVPFEETAVDMPITYDTASPIRVKMKAGGLGTGQGQGPARTRFRCLRRWGDLSLVECRPETGRKHQLRVHLDFLGHPVLGDKLYGQDPEVFLSLLSEGDPEKVADLTDLQQRLGHSRHCLHAHELNFELDLEPSTGKKVRGKSSKGRSLDRVAFKFTAPLSLDMQQLLGRDHWADPN